MAAEIGWKLGMLREMAEMGMEMARDVRDQAVAEPAPEPPAKPSRDSDALARAFARLTRAVRIAIALHTRLEEDHRRQGEASAADRARRATEARDQHRAYQRDKVKRVIDATLDAAAGDDDDDAGEDGNERERLEDEWRERLLDFDDYALGGTRSIGEIIARICRDLGVTPDWTRWVDADWARDEMATKPPGSPYAVWPPVRPARKPSTSSTRSGAAAATGPP
ncbi:MAG: hypothetical protein WCC64_21280 [Aliidongia sp.]